MRSLFIGCTAMALCAAALANAPAAAAADAAVPGVAPAPATATAASSRAGTLRAVRGTVHVASAGGMLRNARAGDPVDRSEQVLTTQDGAAGLVLRDGTALVLGPSSRLELRDFAFDSTTQQGDMWLSLLRGSLRMVTGLIGVRQPAAVRLQARTVTVGIRGTDFIVEVPEE